MPQLEYRLIQMSNHIMVEYSLMSRIIKILYILCDSYSYKEKENSSFIYLDEWKTRFSTKTNSDLYIIENRDLVKDIYNFLQNRKEWEEDFIVNYNTYYEYNDLTGGKIVLADTTHVLNEMDYIAVKLAEIIRSD